MAVSLTSAVPPRALRRRALPRRLWAATYGVVLAVVLAAAGLVAVAVPAAASGNSLDWGDGTAARAFGANAAVTVDIGTLAFDNACPAPADPDRHAVQDFVYPISDIYIMPSGTVLPGIPLHDVTGNR